MNVINGLLLFSSSVSLILGLFIFISNPKKSLNRALASFLTGGVFLWLIANYLTNISSSPNVSLFFARTTLIGACIMPYTFLLFCSIYTRDKNLNINREIKRLIPIILVIATFPTSLNIVSVEAYGNHTVTGAIYFVLVPILFGYISYAIWILLKYYRYSKDLNQKSQILYIFFGITLTFIPSFIANAILPALGNNSAILYAPNSVIFMSIFTTLAIVKHRLLNVRLIVARSVAYILTLVAIGLLYVLFIYGILNRLLGVHSLDVGKQTAYIGTAIFLALSLQSIRHYFDKFSSKIFYRDGYDTQVFLDQLNSLLVSTIDLKALIKGASEIIVENMKLEFCAFVVKNNDKNDIRIIGNDYLEMRKEQVKSLIVSTNKQSENYIIKDEIDDTISVQYEAMNSLNVAVIFGLQNNRSQNSLNSVLLLGAKKSGNPYNKDDIKILKIIRDELTIAIDNALRFEEIAEFNVTLQQKITDATREMRRSNEKLKALDVAKDEFISMASHQLRTPLTSVKGYVSMVLEGDAGKISKVQRELLEEAFTSSQRMVYLIADLLNVSRLRTGKFVIEAVPSNLGDIVEGEVKQLVETAKMHNLELIYEKPKTFPIMNLDETKTRQVIMNFIDNAIYYTPSGGHIRVELKETPHSVEYRVIDDGLGVPKHEQHHLFTKFFRAGNARKARPDGTGLGLFMAKKVIVAQGGGIIFESEEGKGSTFGFTFPRKELEVKPPK